MYPLLRRGDRLPTVAVTQILINRAIRRGEQIAVDGIFGPRTIAAVHAFQRAHHLADDGWVGKDTWRALVDGQDLQVIDAVDITEPDDRGSEDDDIRAAGGDPIVSYGMCAGTQHVVDQIRGRVRYCGAVAVSWSRHPRHPGAD